MYNKYNDREMSWFSKHFGTIFAIMFITIMAIMVAQYVLIGFVATKIVTNYGDIKKEVILTIGEVVDVIKR